MLKQEYEQNQLKKKADLRTENPKEVRIGMTKEEVLKEGWGRPNDINKNNYSIWS